MKLPRDLSLQTAASLDLPESLAPFASALMRDIDALGSFPVPTAALCAKLGLSAAATVLDLACGKGSIAIELSALGFAVTGIDASPEFVASARSLAAARGVKPRFKVGDVSTFRSRHKFDLVVMLNLFPLEEAAEVCRQFVKPGGIILIDDACLAPGTKSSRWSSKAELRAILDAEGDRVLAIRQISAAAVARNARAIEQKVQANGAELCKSHPRLRRQVRAYLTRLKRSRLMLTGPLRPTLFAVQVP